MKKSKIVNKIPLIISMEVMVMLFAFYFFLRKNELRLAQQVRFSLLKLRWMVCHFGIEIWPTGGRMTACL